MTSRSKLLVMAFGTSDNGIWVVASATLRSSVASIITDRFTLQSPAKYSVCPLKSIPASFMIPLWTGPVTTASNS